MSSSLSATPGNFWWGWLHRGPAPPPTSCRTETVTAAGVKGDTVSGATKPAELETGVVIQVPLFVNEGEVVKVDTRDESYLGRAK